MEVRIRYLSHEIAKSFGSSDKVETIHISDDSKYGDVLSRLREKLKHHGEVDERLLDTFVFICGGKALLSIKDEALNSDCEVMVGYADTGG
ncbi:MAG: hypothetical protein OEZ21_03405 [Candidatus Bathyarchaeota archaeon]|nr:hypothetical protein [Candidatus Bathyarchaeota archaeon]MDH5745988.1 hypothetical protein [Candidatus Bathyarchaeota archaeon]